MRYFADSFSTPFGPFSTAVDEDGLSADLADGVLSIRVPKHAKSKPKRIEIGGGNGNGSKRLEE